MYKEYTTIFITGFTVLIIELLGGRIMAPFYGNSIFVWASIIGMTIASLAIGYYLGGRIGKKIPIQLIGLLIMITIIPMVLNHGILELTSELGVAGGSLMAATLLFAPAIILFGMYSPIIIHSLDKQKDAGKLSGKVFAVGTVGSFFGAMITGFILIPNMPINAILGLCVLIMLCVNLINSKGKKPRNNRNNTIGVVFAIVLMSIISFLMNQSEIENNNVNVLFDETSMYGNVKVVEVKNGWNALLVDGSLQSYTHINGKTLVPFANYAKIVYAINPEINDVLILGLGSGGLSMLFEEKSNITTIEIDPNMKKMSSEVFGYNGEVIIDDARHYIQSNDKMYDAVIYDIATGDSFPPHLFTQEMFQSVEDKLNDNGVVTVHFDGKIDSIKLKSLYKTLDSVFDNVFLISLGDDILDAKIYYATNGNIDKEFMISNIEYAYDNTSEQGVYSNQINNRIEHLDGGIIMTDQYNPIDIWQMESTQAWREYTWENFGEYL